MDVGLRAAHVLWGDLLEVLLVGEHAGLLEQLDGIPCIPELGRDIRDQVDEVLADGARVQRELRAARDDVPKFPSIVFRELDDIGSAERAERGAVHVLQRVRPLRDEDHRDVALRGDRLLGDPSERVDQVRAALLQEGVHFVQDHDEVKPVLLEMPPQRLHLLCNRESPFGEVGVKMLDQPEQDRVVPHPLATVHEIPVDGPIRFRRVFLEIEAEALRRVGLPGSHGPIQEGVARGSRPDDGPQEAEEPLRLPLPMDHLFGEVVERQFPLVLEDGGPGPERHNRRQGGGRA